MCLNCTALNQKALSRRELLNRHYRPVHPKAFDKYESRVQGLSPFDYKEDGSFDLMVNYQDENGVTRMAVLESVSKYDAFIMKVLPVGSGREDSNGLAWGVTLHWFVNDINGDSIASVGNQNAHPVAGSLALPYHLAGLGRTNNYVEHLMVGYSAAQDNVREWTPIIPNSQLIVVPAGTRAADWLINIYIKPTDKIYLVLLITVGILLLLGLLILFYHRLEKEEDNRAREQFFHLIR
jgi:integrin alpha FG-GAP repeat containing protein 1